MKVIYSARADKDLERLERSTAQRIIKKVKEFTDQENPLVQAKALSGEFLGLHRFRVGDFRIIFSVDKNGSISIFTILHIAHRKDIYK